MLPSEAAVKSAAAAFSLIAFANAAAISASVSFAVIAIVPPTVGLTIDIVPSGASGVISVAKTNDGFRANTISTVDPSASAMTFPLVLIAAARFAAILLRVLPGSTVYANGVPSTRMRQTSPGSGTPDSVMVSSRMDIAPSDSSVVMFVVSVNGAFVALRILTVLPSGVALKAAWASIDPASATAISASVSPVATVWLNGGRPFRTILHTSPASGAPARVTTSARRTISPVVVKWFVTGVLLINTVEPFAVAV